MKELGAISMLKSSLFSDTDFNLNTVPEVFDDLQVFLGVLNLLPAPQDVVKGLLRVGCDGADDNGLAEAAAYTPKFRDSLA